jgi:hypothetical protein
MKKIPRPITEDECQAIGIELPAKRPASTSIEDIIRRNLKDHDLIKLLGGHP